MNRQQIISTGLLMLDEMGFISYREPDLANGVLGTYTVWENALKKLDDRAVAAGFDWLVETWTNEYNRKPTPGDIKKFVNESLESGYGDLWAEINKRKWDSVNGVFNRELGECVRYRFSPEAQQVIDQMGGIEVFLSMTTAQERQLFAQFRDLVAANNKKAQLVEFSGPLIEAKKQQEKVIQLAAAKQDLAERKAEKETQAETIDNATPIIDGIKAQFFKKQALAQQQSREAKKAQLDAYIAEYGVEVESLIPGEFWKDGDQELSVLEGKIESMANALKGLKVV